MGKQVLVVDDDPLICKGLKFNLSKEGYQVVTACNAANAIEQLNFQTFELAILDIGLPGQDGLSLCQYIKSKFNLPVIFLTARRRDLDEIVGLQVGADDYITKPFNVDVLIARMKAVLRRQAFFAESRQPVTPEMLSAGRFTLDPISHRVTLDGEPLQLAPREFDLMRFFLSYPDHVFTSDEIVERVWGVEYTGEPQVLYVQIRSLREKIEEDPSNPLHIQTLRGVGYKFVL